MSVIVTGIEMPKSCGECNASGTGVCRKWFDVKEIGLKRRLGDAAHALAPVHDNAGSLLQGHVGVDQDAVGDVRVVAAVFLYGAAGVPRGKLWLQHLQVQGDALGGQDVHIGNGLPRRQHQRGGLRRGSGTGPCRVAVIELFPVPDGVIALDPGLMHKTECRRRFPQ